MGVAVVATLQQRRLKLTFQLATGSFNEAGEPDTVTYDWARAQVEIDAMGGYEFANARIRVYGLAQDIMNRLTVINYYNTDVQRNVLRIEAGNRDGQLTTVFLGEMYMAAADYAGAPEVAFVAEARAGIVGSLAPSNPRSYPGPQSVAVIMGQLAEELGVTLENNGVDVTVTDQTLAGTALDKVQRLANTAQVQYWYLPEQGVLSIAPRNQSRESDAVPVSQTDGMVGWPTKTPTGVIFTALFNPSVFQGVRVKLDTVVTACAGEWYISSMSHRLDAETPGGAWFTHFNATSVNVAVRR